MAAKVIKANGKCRFLFGVYFSLNCVILSYAAYYLGEREFTDFQISLIVALGCGIVTPLQFLAGRIGDKYPKFNWKTQLTVYSIVALVLAHGLMFFDGIITIGIIYTLLILILLLMLPMINSSVFYYSKRGIKADFGIARGIGSGVFAIVSYIVGYLTDEMGEKVIPTLIALFAALVLIIVQFLPRIDYIEVIEEDEKEVNNNASSVVVKGRFFKRYPLFIVTAIGSALALAFHNMVSTFYINMIEGVGGDSSDMGIALGIAAISELPVLFLYDKISKKIKLSTMSLVAIACGFFVLRGILYVFSVNVIMIYCVALLQSLSFALLVAAKTALSDETMAEEDKITGQSMMAMTDAFGAVAGNIIGGVIIGYGVTPMLIVGSLIALVGTIIVFIAARINSKRKLRIQ